jgi:tight adherence protein B
MDTIFYSFAVAIFIAVVLFLEGIYLTWNSSKGPEARRIGRRLRSMSAGGHGDQTQISIIKQRLLSETPLLNQLLLALPRTSTIDRLLMQSGLSMSTAEWFGLTGLGALLGFLVPLFFGMPMLIALCAALLAGSLPLLYVMRAKHKRLVKIEKQLPDAIDLMGRALRAGHAFPTGVKMVADEMQDPIAGEFKLLYDEVNYGISMPDALLNLANRIPSTDLKYFVIAVLIQRDTGGNLAELLDNISAIIRARLKLLGMIRVLSAEGKLSAWILTLLPFATAGMISVVNPDFMKILWTDPSGRKMLAAAGIMMVFGILWMRKIIRIRV